jgi:hypothetical protein
MHLLKDLRRVAMGVVLALTLMVGTMGVGQAQDNNTGQAQAQFNAEHQVKGPDLSTPAALQRFLIQYPEAAFTAAAEEIHAGITLAKDGTFVTTNPKFTARVAQVDAAIRSYRASVGQPTRLLGAVQAQAWWRCGYFPNWELDAMAWYVTIVGGVTGVIGAFVSASIFGLPLGALMVAAGFAYGTTGQVMLWVFDKYYPNGMWICW